MNDDLFTKEDSTILKGIAICLMVYYYDILQIIFSRILSY